MSHCGSHVTSEPSDDSGSLSDAAIALALDCGTRTHTSGQTFRTVTVQGKSRTYYAYLPASLDAATAVPFVFVTHGALMDAADMVAVTQYEALADSEGIAVAFLDGQDTSSMTGTETLEPWNVSDNGAAVCGAGDLANNPTAGVDFAFMDAVEADVALDQCLDAAHIFATGFSMGGYFTHHVGCDRTDVRAIAPHSGATIASLSACKTGHVPAIIFHGTSDPVIEEGCDDPNGTAQSGFPPSATLWAQKNGCAHHVLDGHRRQRGGWRRPVLPLRRMPGGRAGRALHVHRHGALLGGRQRGRRSIRLPDVRERDAAGVEFLQAARVVNELVIAR
jgi:poly(3-hydroxybutyrate) depolymerase